MGAQPSKLNKVLSRTNTDSSSNSSSRKSGKNQHNYNHHYHHKDFTSHSLTPISALPLGTPLVGGDPSSDNYSDSQATDSQFTDSTPVIFGIVGGGDSGPVAPSESAVSSKTNLSSFLSSIRSKGGNKESKKEGSATAATAASRPDLVDSDSNEQQRGVDQEDRLLDDLKEQKQQKKINKMKEKAHKQQLRQQQQQQQQQNSSLPYQNQSGAATWSTLAASGSASSPQSLHSFTVSSPAVNHSLTSSPKAKSATGVFSSSKTGPDPTFVPYMGIMPMSMPSVESSSQTSSRSANSSPSFFTTSRSGKDKSGVSPLLNPASPSLSFSAMPPPQPSNSTTSLPNANSSSSSRPRASFIRGKPGFAWLEKRLPPVSSDMDDDKNLNNDNWTYQQGQMLNEMEIEAAKGYVDRITDQHFLMKDVMGGNYHASIDLAFKRVLENGCGAGDWTLDMASEMPETDFIGCPQIMFTTSNAEKNTPILRPRGLLGADQSQMGSTSPNALLSVPDASTASLSTSPSSSAAHISTSTSSTTLSGNNMRPNNIRPRNCSFHPDVPLNRLPFPNEQFDFVYQRRQSVVLMSTEWQRTVLELFRVIKRGGWVEIVEPDLFLRGGGELCKLAGEYCVGIFEAMGRNPNVIHEMAHLLENAGFVNVQVKVWSIPLGWGGVVGQAMLVNQRGFVNELEPIYVRQGHGDSEEYRELTKSIFEEVVEKKAYINYHVIVGQKPASASERLAHQQMQKQKEEELQRQQQQQQQQQQLEQQQEIFRQQQQQLLQQQQLYLQQQQQQQLQQQQLLQEQHLSYQAPAQEPQPPPEAPETYPQGEP